MFFVDLYMQTLSLLIMTTRDVNDAELLMPSRDFHFRKKNEPVPSRDSSQASPSRVDILGY